MTPLFMLDTDVASYVIRGPADAVRHKLTETPLDRLCISVLTRAELMFGLRRLPAEHRLHLLVRRFLERVRVLPWTEEAADHYADIRHRLTVDGLLIGEIDMMIAAHSLAADAVLVTNNLRHFERIRPPLLLQAWLQD